MKRIYITHCSAEKEDSLRGIGKKVIPEKLYTSKRLQGFIRKCKEEKVMWAIFSDKYGIVFPQDEIEWYDKHPNNVSECEFQSLFNNFVKKLSKYDKICFYYNPGPHFHRLYKKLLREVKKRGLRVLRITHLRDIVDVCSRCRWLHEELEILPLFRYPFKLESLPKNGIYFFYEEGEVWGHDSDKPHMVRVGTHKGGNFRSRISEHFLFKEKKMDFDKNKPKPADRSIFRKHIGMALLNQKKDPYLEKWNKGFIMLEERKHFGNLRNIKKEKKIERKITKILRKHFSFRFIIIEDERKRIGSKGLEKHLIGTLARCSKCRSSSNWQGRHHPKEKIKESSLWNFQHQKSEPINERDKHSIKIAIKKTKEWFKNQN